MASHTSVGRPHATKSSIEETHASQTQAQSNLMKYPTEDFIQIDERKCNDIPAYGTVERKSLEWKISNLVTNLVRHRAFTNQKLIKQYIRVPCAQCYDMRFKSEGAQTYSDSQWLGLYPRRKR